MQVRHLFLGAAATALASVLAHAQAPSPSMASEPSSSARLEYRSAFEGYRAYQEPEARSWRASNEEAAALGGHAGHLKSPMKSTVPPASKPEATTQPGDSASQPMTPAAPGHQGHGK